MNVLHGNSCATLAAQALQRLSRCLSTLLSQQCTANLRCVSKHACPMKSQHLLPSVEPQCFLAPAILQLQCWAHDDRWNAAVNSSSCIPFCHSDNFRQPCSYPQPWPPCQT
jgi:hypothetical protein